ncbi:unnamed protein product [Penicillium camemberti]|uniref:Str. FM013 n=1 Tax=Penicillium camemberti (strain FM 013) TaxID=1429867 RepID=A0A0G4PRM6_PENC3|nr:unnamed protein product [Penicillium camemberti]
MRVMDATGRTDSPTLHGNIQLVVPGYWIEYHNSGGLTRSQHLMRNLPLVLLLCPSLRA